MDEAGLNRNDRKKRIRKMIMFVVICLLINLLYSEYVHAEETLPEDTQYIQLRVRVGSGSGGRVNERNGVYGGAKYKDSISFLTAESLRRGTGNSTSGDRGAQTSLTVHIEGLDGLRPYPEELTLSDGETGSFRIPVTEEGVHRFRVFRYQDEEKKIECRNCVYVVYAEVKRSESGSLDPAVWITKNGHDGKVDEISFISGDGEDDEEEKPSVTPLPTTIPSPTSDPGEEQARPTVVPDSDDGGEAKVTPHPTGDSSTDSRPGNSPAITESASGGKDGRGGTGGLLNLVGSVLTGDESNLVLYLIIFLTSVVLLVLFRRLNRKYKT